jgi:hypothetical protein
MLAIESIELKTLPAFEAFGSSAFELMYRFKDNKQYGEMIKAFTETLLANCSSQQIDMFKKLTQEQCNERIKASKANEKPVLKYKERKTEMADDDSEDEDLKAKAVGGFVMEDDETLRKKEITEMFQSECERRATLLEAEKVDFRLMEKQNNQAMIKFKERRVEVDAKALAEKGFVMLEPPAWDKKGKGKGKK